MKHSSKQNKKKNWRRSIYHVLGLISDLAMEYAVANDCLKQEEVDLVQSKKRLTKDIKHEIMNEICHKNYPRPHSLHPLPPYLVPKLLYIRRLRL